MVTVMTEERGLWIYHKGHALCMYNTIYVCTYMYAKYYVTCTIHANCSYYCIRMTIVR